MTPSELVKELDRLREGARHEDSHSGAMIFESKLRIIVENKFDLIFKCLRFAADMERLKILEIRAPRYTGDVWTIFHLRGGRHLMTEGPDIQSAARKAVEALEGKQ